jgi:ADP-ribosylglycohydrolase
MDLAREQQECIKSCANLGKSATDTLAMIRQAIGEEGMSRMQASERHAQFRVDQKR